MFSAGRDEHGETRASKRKKRQATIWKPLEAVCWETWCPFHHKKHLCVKEGKEMTCSEETEHNDSPLIFF